MKITPATRITLAGIGCCISCAFFFLDEDYFSVLIFYLLAIFSDIFDGIEARKSGESSLGHICDRLIRDPLLFLIFFLLLIKKFNFNFFAGVVLGMEVVFFMINIFLAIRKISEGRKFYFFWNYIKQTAYAVAGVLIVRDFI